MLMMTGQSEHIKYLAQPKPINTHYFYKCHAFFCAKYVRQLQNGTMGLISITCKLGTENISLDG